MTPRISGENSSSNWRSQTNLVGDRRKTVPRCLSPALKPRDAGICVSHESNPTTFFSVTIFGPRITRKGRIDLAEGFAF
ncbi:hypothetical protein Pfo_016906 [Paulownia fortunei]|nr:hypothetical protein Pfo_016906 [Paulownia fortunei]